MEFKEPKNKLVVHAILFSAAVALLLIGPAIVDRIYSCPGVVGFVYCGPKQ